VTHSTALADIIAFRCSNLPQRYNEGMLNQILKKSDAQQLKFGCTNDILASLKKLAAI
jgi:hypothetical protein